MSFLTMLPSCKIKMFRKSLTCTTIRLTTVRT